MKPWRVTLQGFRRVTLEVLPMKPSLKGPLKGERGLLDKCHGKQNEILRAPRIPIWRSLKIEIRLRAGAHDWRRWQTHDDCQEARNMSSIKGIRERLVSWGMTFCTNELIFEHRVLELADAGGFSMVVLATRPKWPKLYK